MGEPVLHEISGLPTTDRRWANGFLAVTDMRLIFIVPTFSTWLAPGSESAGNRVRVRRLPMAPHPGGRGAVARSDRAPEPPVLAIELADGYR